MPCNGLLTETIFGCNYSKFILTKYFKYLCTIFWYELLEYGTLQSPGIHKKQIV